MTRVIISGPIANKCGNGGIVWIPLSYILGLKRLGFDVFFLEQLSRSSEAGAEAVSAFSFFERIATQFGLDAAIVSDEGDLLWGDGRELDAALETADLLINISGHLTAETLRRRVPHKVYIDEDPGFTQFWYADDSTGLHLEGHDFYFTLGTNIGRRDCPIPPGDIRWLPLKPFVVLDEWPEAARPPEPRFTSVAAWRGPYGVVTYEGKTYGLKVHEFRRFVSLPRDTRQKFELALDIDPADQKDRELLTLNGWDVVDPAVVAPLPGDFRAYIQGSGAEFSVAKGVYVETNSGWFSDRSVRYLASGRPVLLQETGFSRCLPAGEGLLAYRDLDDAIRGASDIERNYEKHCRAARALAVEYFDSDKVLCGLLEQIGVSP